MSKQKKTKKPGAVKTTAPGKNKQSKNKRKNKNISKNVKIGTTLQTRDEYLYSGKNYKKPGYEKKGNYRRVLVVDSNKKDELAVVKLTTSEKAKQVGSYQKGKARYKPILETKTNESKPIKVSKKFQKNRKSRNIPKNEVNKIKKDLFVLSKQKHKNRSRVRRLKKRK